MRPDDAIRAKCFHLADTFVEFLKEEVELSIPNRFEKIVNKYPDRTAIKTANHILTYSELNVMANRVARAILAHQGTGVAPVGLLFEKDAPLMVAMLGVLKAGKFFVLLDPSFPQARLTTVLGDSQASLLVTNRENVLLAREVASAGCRLLEFESVDCCIPAEDSKLCVSPKALVCIAYTSGSTGQPKGVVWDHRYLLHCIMLRTRENHACEHDRVVLLSSSTGNAVTNIFLALLNGAALLPFDVQKEGVTRLASWLLQERISICPISSPLFRNFCETLTGEERFPDLRVIRLRSETVYKNDVDLYKKYFSPNCTFLTGLSSGEAGQLTTYVVNHNTEIAGSEVPVGYAVEDKEILLLGDTGEEVGFNQVGEIAVRSRYLSSGYWRRPDLTEAKFNPDPEDSERRLYLTGDLGLMLPDGCLIHKGRKDFRVKVRGYGVEFAEVEKALLEHAFVKEAVVVAPENQLGEARLVAYFTSLSPPSPSVSELRGFLKKKLPDYMVPSAFVIVDAIPLTANGKVDRRALPDPGNSKPELDTPFLAPRTSKEEELVKIWAEVLGLDQIGIHDNFFDLGGHSLLATRVISRIRDDLQAELSLSHFFETPTVAALAGYIETARPPQDIEALSIRSASRGGEPLLSFAQQRLWFLDQLEPGSAAYNLFSAVQLTGQLNVTALEQSVNEIIGRHEALRTVFKAVDGKPFQIILPSMTIKVPVVDLRKIVSDTERDYEVRRLSTAEAQRTFDLGRGPLLRVTLLRLTGDEYVLLLTMHHIVFDGWSIGILAQELSALYAAFCSGRPLALPALPVQYADFAQWQRQWLQGRVLDAQLAYWKKKLEDVPTLQLPTDRPRPPLRTARGARQYFVLSKTLSAGLKSLSSRHGVTLFMTLLAAYQTLLHRYTGQNDIVTGSPVAGRNHSQLESLIGFFINMLVLRADLSGNPTFRELLARVKETCLEAYAHQDLPFEKLVEELHLERNLSHNPLFQVTFALQNTPRFPLELTGLTANDLEVYAGTARFDLHLFLVEEERGVRGYMDYNTDLFNAGTITRMLNHFQTLLEGIVANPDERIGRLPLLTEAERYQLLVEWNDTKTDYPKDKCIHQLFEEQSELTPEAIAVVYEDQRLTYRELNRRANQLAHYLRTHGVGPEVLVGICVERSLEMVVGLLGILKAGGAYVPLEPSYPKERLAFMLEETRAPVLLTQQRLVKNLLEHGAYVVCLDRDWEIISREQRDNPIPITEAENSAYVTYTSGSTGAPKGVSVVHRGVVRLVRETNYAELTEKEIFLQFAPLSFDASTFEIWACLLNGAKLVMFPPYTPSLKELGQVLKQSQVTTLWLTSALFRLMVENHIENFSGIKQLLTGGEVLSVSHVKRVFEERRDCRLINGYGPTENTTFTCCYKMTNAEQLGGSVSIGRPIANTQVYILDHHLNPVLIGVSGELYIGGAGLARGYLDSQDLTAEKFIPHPFSNESGARLYKTGDLARYLPDGNIEFLGRLDRQVKIRGFRIELGEIEAVLSQHPAVRDTTVVDREESQGEKRLVAYVVFGQGQATAASDLRDFLKIKLPEYMLPSAFVFLDSLPLTLNGKIDRRALPAPDQSRPDGGSLFAAPRAPIEELIGKIWAGVLKVEKVGVHDNFFELGGHSLLATQVVSRVREALQVDLPLRAMFEKPTVEELVVTITKIQCEKIDKEDVRRILAELEPLSDDEIQHHLKI